MELKEVSHAAAQRRKEIRCAVAPLREKLFIAHRK